MNKNTVLSHRSLVIGILIIAPFWGIVSQGYNHPPPPIFALKYLAQLKNRSESQIEWQWIMNEQPKILRDPYYCLRLINQKFCKKQNLLLYWIWIFLNPYYHQIFIFTQLKYKNEGIHYIQRNLVFFSTFRFPQNWQPRFNASNNRICYP